MFFIHKMFSLKSYFIPLDLLAYVVLKFVSYFELDAILPCFRLTPKEQALIKFKIYKQRIQIIKLLTQIEYRIEGKLHREGDLHAVEYKDLSKEWYLNGKRHRLNGPAYKNADGYKAWYINGIRHRIDGPAIEYTSGTKQWYINDELHRTDGPAIEYINGRKEWYVHGNLHRIDGPAIERADGTLEYWINGVQVPEF